LAHHRLTEKSKRDDDGGMNQAVEDQGKH
jgi:hypothetical protein